MNNKKELLDRELYKIITPILFLLSLLAVYILYIAVSVYENPMLYPGMKMYISMLFEHLLASVVILLGLGTAFEYLSQINF